jgi:hypothetical protein
MVSRGYDLLFMYCRCDRAGQLGGMSSLGMEERGEGCGYSEVLRL